MQDFFTNPVNKGVQISVPAKMQRQKIKATLSEEEKLLRREKRREKRKEIRKSNSLSRAATLKRKYPDMKGIPRSLSKGKRKKLIKEYRAMQLAAGREK